MVAQFSLICDNIFCHHQRWCSYIVSCFTLFWQNYECYLIYLHVKRITDWCIFILFTSFLLVRIYKRCLNKNSNYILVPSIKLVVDHIRHEFCVNTHIHENTVEERLCTVKHYKNGENCTDTMRINVRRGWEIKIY